MLSVCDDGTIAAEDHEKAVIPINRLVVNLIEKNKASHLLIPRCNLALCSHVDYTVAIVMRWYVLVFLSCSLIAACAGCKKHEASHWGSSANQESNQAELDVCGLIAKQEIEAVQRSPIKETKSSVRSDAGFRVSQCFYTAEDFSKSVSLAVTQRDLASSGKRSVQDFWNETFGRLTDEEKKSNSDKEERTRLREQARREGEEKAFIPPKKIDGIGDDAFWSPNPAGGAIYVLKKDVFIRLSIGGHDNEEAKLDKSKALAQKAIDRL
ncbi:MAG: hypothetical protein WA183_08280 [Chthoniobacterales bacterium]